MKRRIYCDNLIDDETDTIVLDNNIILKSINREKEMINQNNTDIKNIEVDLIELKEVFQDLGLTVVHQGEELNEAVVHVEAADRDIAIGVEKLEKAAEKAASIRYKKVATKVAITAIGAGIGAIVAGPVGLAFSLKIGAIFTGVGTAMGAGVATII